MIKLYDSNITDILPEYFTVEPETKALGYAISQAMKRLVRYCENTSVYAIIDRAPDNVLDMLALELNTQYYDDKLDIEIKRKLIKHTLVWYMHSGTPSAVEELVANVFGEGEVKEWFEYGDDPYYFKIITNATMTPEMDKQFSTMLESVKNKRSHIRAIEIHRTVEQPLMAGAAIHPNYKPAAVIDGYDVAREATQTLYSIPYAQANTKPAAVIDGFKDESTVSGTVYSGGGVSESTKQAAVIDGFRETADAVSGTVFSGTAERSSQKAEAILENLKDTASPVTQAITAGVAADNSRYKNTITE